MCIFVQCHIRQGAVSGCKGGAPPDAAGVARQYCGRPGKVDNCQAGMYLAYVAPGYTEWKSTRITV